MLARLGWKSGAGWSAAELEVEGGLKGQGRERPEKQKARSERACLGAARLPFLSPNAPIAANPKEHRAAESGLN